MGGASFFTTTSLSSMTKLLESGETQRKNVEKLVKGNDQYFRTVTRLLRSMDFQQTGETAEAEKYLRPQLPHLKTRRINWLRLKPLSTPVSARKPRII